LSSADVHVTIGAVDSDSSSFSDPRSGAAEAGGTRREAVAYALGAVVVAVVVFGGGLVIDLALWVIVALAAVVVAAASAMRVRRRRGGRTGTFASATLHYGVAGVATLVLIQAVPYGRTVSNPPVLGEPAWADDRTREMMVAACFDCHSNNVHLAWYSKIAPLSWAVNAHIESGRESVNYSEFVRDPGEAAESVEVILDGSMPPAYYTYFGRHPDARFTDVELAELVAGLQATPGMGGADRSDRSDDE